MDHNLPTPCELLENFVILHILEIEFISGVDINFYFNIPPYLANI